MWSFSNPVNIQFGEGVLSRLPELLDGQNYALLTYDEPWFSALADQVISQCGVPVAVLNQIVPNPDIKDLLPLCQQLSEMPVQPDVLVAIGGGSVIDTAKVVAAAGEDFDRVYQLLTQGKGREELVCTPIIAVPTTSGTGSEVTCWATVWDSAHERKYSLADPRLYPQVALCDPSLTHELPEFLTICTGLDALSHALESIWNKNNNPVSSTYAVDAARIILNVLPELAADLNNAALRSRMMEAALKAGLAFSNTKTSIAHNISYEVTLRRGTPHGIACSFTLPYVMRSVSGENSVCDQALKAIFGEDLAAGSDYLENWLKDLGIKVQPEDYQYDPADWQRLLTSALAGERGKNFIGQGEALLTSYAV
ncbi:iron-containing alcohol dehydrogenase PsrA [Endozoicomonas arenosclerae]|uniref:iron-containing alcohol dehydrogenase PsrA n=1 Tax=Endozoicomonas arenosclerae TaxID=1633495 RepID=UPI000B0478F0|nr:iron-containing alcohol dehydrogenase PsrA [Endozoicomonas arenosclerae]